MHVIVHVLSVCDAVFNVCAFRISCLRISPPLVGDIGTCEPILSLYFTVRGTIESAC